jgi:hypothetical protein
MTDYTVRVELHQGGDYSALHTAMERQGYVRFIVSGDGRRYALPTAEYNLVGSNLSAEQVVNHAMAIAKTIRQSPEPWVLATASAGRAWSTKVI